MSARAEEISLWQYLGQVEDTLPCIGSDRSWRQAILQIKDDDCPGGQYEGCDTDPGLDLYAHGTVDQWPAKVEP